VADEVWPRDAVLVQIAAGIIVIVHPLPPTPSLVGERVSLPVVAGGVGHFPEPTLR
jgi:hypothetical protein